MCALVITKSKVNTDPIGVKHGLWPLRCPQRNLEFLNNLFNKSSLIIVLCINESLSEVQDIKTNYGQIETDLDHHIC